MGNAETSGSQVDQSDRDADAASQGHTIESQCLSRCELEHHITLGLRDTLRKVYCVTCYIICAL